MASDTFGLLPTVGTKCFHAFFFLAPAATSLHSLKIHSVTRPIGFLPKTYATPLCPSPILHRKTRDLPRFHRQELLTPRTSPSPPNAATVPFFAHFSQRAGKLRRCLAPPTIPASGFAPRRFAPPQKTRRQKTSLRAPLPAPSALSPPYPFLSA